METTAKQALGVAGLVLIGAVWYAINGIVGVAIVVGAIVLAVVILRNAKSKKAPAKE